MIGRIFYNDWGRLREGWEMLVFALFILAVLVAVIGVIIGPILVINSQKCGRLAEWDSAHEYRWTFWTDCRVMSSDGYWIPVDSLQYNNVYLKEAPR